jgi:hypothetical protein
MLRWIDEVLEDERLLKADRAKKAKTARERRRGEGKSLSSERGGTIGN